MNPGLVKKLRKILLQYVQFLQTPGIFVALCTISTDLWKFCCGMYKLEQFVLRCVQTLGTSGDYAASCTNSRILRKFCCIVYKL